MKQNQSLTPILFVVVAALSLAGGYWVSQQKQRAQGPDFGSEAGVVVFPEARQPGDFSLLDQDKQAFDNSRLQGKWSLMFFGFTHCPDICPTTLKTLQTFWRGLSQPVQERTQVIFMSVDPKRDTPEIIREYVQYFEPGFIGATGDLEQITAFTRSIGVFFEYIAKGKDDANYDVNHSAQIMLFNPQGKLHAVFPAPHDPAKMQAGYNKIIDYYKD